MARFCIAITWDDSPHLSEESKKALYDSIPPAQRDARTKGVPQIGAGAIYPIPEEDILCEPFDIPAWYRKAYGFDVGWQRTAALWGAIDPDEDVLYCYSEYYQGQAEPETHVQGIKARGEWVPGAADPASRIGSQKDGEKLFDVYRKLGLNLVQADNAVEAGTLDVWHRLLSGRLKIFSTLTNFRSEFRIYRRDEKGRVVKKNDHLQDCLRYLVRTGIGIAAQPPPDRWGPMSQKSRHQSTYDASAALYGPMPNLG